jgi:hypothetical protein
MDEKKIKLNQLRQYQALPLAAAERLAEVMIREAWDHYEGYLRERFLPWDAPNLEDLP